jgi:AraC-like DNA-binding protein
MKKASQLLHNTDYPIKEIAQAVGYQNQFHFSKAFRKYYNTSPSEWRKQFE